MNTLIFGAHPDDVEIGAGGSISKFVKLGYKVCIVLVTVPNNKKVRVNEAKEAAKILGSQINILALDPYELVNSRKLVEIFDKIISDFNPEQIFTHWNRDSHQDHVAITDAVIASTRKNNCSVYMYEQTVPGGVVPYAFRSQLYIDITDDIKPKLDSTLAHKSQVKNNKMSWIDGIEGRAKYHGYQVGFDYAETFEIIKQIGKY